MTQAITNATLKAELTNDPLGIGYAALQDQAAADAMNDASRGRTVSIASVPSSSFVAAIDPTEFAALAILALNQLNVLITPANVNVGSLNVRGMITAIFPILTAPTTRANLIALATRLGSRAEELFGDGILVTNTQIAAARAS